MVEFNPAKKALGQNFLHDQNIIQKILDAFAAQADDTVVEIGPGRGALTEGLLLSQARLHLIEFDYSLADYWQSRTEQHATLTVHRGNALKFDYSGLSDGQKLRVIGNLPYNISSQILIRLLNNIDCISDIVAMLQLEMVERIVAGPDNKQYGRLSVILQQSFKAEKLFKVPSGAFHPAPKVESAIVRLMPHNDPELQVNDQKYFSLVVQSAFAQRRKTLRNTLKRIASAQQLESLGIDPGARAENLRVVDFVRLANARELVG